MDKVSVADKLAQISDQWSPKVVGGLDGYEIKLLNSKATLSGTNTTARMRCYW